MRTRAAHLIIAWADSGWNGVPWIGNVLPAAFPQRCIFIWLCTVLTQLELRSAASCASPCLEERWTRALECFDCVFVEFASQTPALLYVLILHRRAGFCLSEWLHTLFTGPSQALSSCFIFGYSLVCQYWFYWPSVFVLAQAATIVRIHQASEGGLIQTCWCRNSW